MTSSRLTAARLTRIGRIVFAIAMLVFGIQLAVLGRLVDSLPPLPYWLPHPHLLAYFAAAILVLTSLALLTGFRIRVATQLLAGFLLAGALLHLTHLHRVLHQAGPRTNFLQPLCFAAAAFILSGLLAAHSAPFRLIPARLVFAFSMIVFGAQHFMLTAFIASLVPAWIPAHTFWALLTGATLIAAGLAIAFRVADRLASLGLFALFFGWLVLLHIPLWIATPHSVDLFTDMILVLGLCASSLLLAAQSRPTIS